MDRRYKAAASHRSMSSYVPGVRDLDDYGA
jgi:hypothetical protein